ncbi:MAG: FimV family protein [Gammaproteobacteria bacterium]|nr:FimV family protein [Gammaproteobacteria bacterium]
MRYLKVKRLTGRLVLGAFLGLSPLSSFALGLGKLKVQSALNEPLKAEIDFTTIADNERRGLNVTLAPRADFEAAGAERLPFLSAIKFEVVKRPDGHYFLELKTEQPIEEPFLHLLLQLEWPGGRLVREYTALVDPPAYMVNKPAAVEVPTTPAEPPASVETVPPPETAPAPAATTETPTAPQPEPSVSTAAPAAEPTVQEVPAPAAQTEEAAPQPTDTGETVPSETPAATPESTPTTESSSAESTAPSASAGPHEVTVRAGDTVWAIAENVRADKQLTVEQVILAIFKNNPDAFFRNNVNNLRAGKVLKIPEREVIEALATVQARREFRAHYDSWQEYKLKLAAGSNTLKVNEESTAAASTAAPAATESATVVPAPEGQPKAADDTLKIVRGAADKNSAKAGGAEAVKDERTALADRASTLEESLESKQLENRELADKVGQVREQIKNEKRLIELDNQALAQQTQKPAETKAATTPEVAKTEPVPAPVAPAPEPAKAETLVKPAPVVPKPAPEPVAEKGFMTSLLEDVLGGSALPILGILFVVLGGGLLIVYLRRRQRSIAEFEESILASDAIATETPTGSGDTTGQAVTTGDTSFLSDFSKAGMGHMQTDEVDPIAEAEVYLAYGRDETAEEILKEAIVKNPDRQELKQKLLEIYHQRNDVNGFETLAEELYASLGGRGGKMWEKIEEMGRKLNPDNPMFRGGAPDRRTADKPASTEPVAAAADETAIFIPEAAASAAVEFSAASAPTQLVEPTAAGIDFEAPAEPADASFDFDLGESTPETVPTNEAADDLGVMDFSAGGDNVIDFESAKSEPVVAAASAELAVPHANDEEIKWELDAPMPETAVVETVEPSANGAGEQGQEAHWDETATKLDLAKAYIDMGDADGARSILDEVLAEGNEQQKKQAAELAAQIA